MADPLRILVVDDHEYFASYSRQESFPQRIKKNLHMAGFHAVDIDLAGSIRGASGRLGAARDAGRAYHIAVLDNQLPITDLDFRVDQDGRVVHTNAGSSLAFLETSVAPLHIKPRIIPWMTLEGLPAWQAHCATRGYDFIEEPLRQKPPVRARWRRLLPRWRWHASWYPVSPADEPTRGPTVGPIARPSVYLGVRDIKQPTRRARRAQFLSTRMPDSATQ